MKQNLGWSTALAALAACATLAAGIARAAGSDLRVGPHELGGSVTSPHGPEAGVWVIAETDELATRYAKIVVTDDSGRYLIPDLPAARYRLWVRGYGLADSARTEALPGHTVKLAAVLAADAAAAAKVYPAAYWYALMKIPADAELTKLAGGRNAYLMWMKNMGCIGCHQLGNLATRTIPASLGKFESSEQAWARRIHR